MIAPLHGKGETAAAAGSDFLIKWYRPVNQCKIQSSAFIENDDNQKLVQCVSIAIEPGHCLAVMMMLRINRIVQMHTLYRINN